MIRLLAIISIILTTLTVSCPADEPEPTKIFEKVIATYKSMETYQSEGTVTSNMEMDGKIITSFTNFSILLKKPNLYRISWTQNNPGPNVQSGVVWSDGTQPYVYMGTTKVYSPMTNDEYALATATGISGGVAFTIPSIFLSVFKENHDPFSRLINPKLEGIEQVADEECFVISGSSNASQKETYWISKSRNLIVKYSRSLEVPKEAAVMPEMTDEQLTESVKAAGKEITKENKDQIKAVMKMAKDIIKNSKFKGSSTEIHIQIFSPELDKKDFQFVLPEGAVLKKSLFDISNMFQAGKLESLEIVHSGFVKVNEVRKRTGDDIPQNLCLYLSEPQFMEQTDTVPASLKTAFGVAFKVQGEPKNGFVDLNVKYLHPSITDPILGKVSTSDEVKITAPIDKIMPVGWIFDHEWEIVSGPWTIQILKDEKILAEKTFNVTKVDDIFATLGEAGKRIKQLKEMIAKNSKDAMVVKNLGNAYLAMGDNEAAILEYTKAIAIEPQPNFFNNRCLAWNNEKEYAKALKDCNKALTMNPAHTSALINRGNTFRLQGEYDKAIEDYNQSLQVAPAGDIYNPPMAYYNRALAYKAQEKLNEAVSDFTKTIELEPKNADAYYSRAEIYEDQGDLTHAIADYQKTLEMKPGYLPAKKKLFSLTTMHGQ